MSMAPTRGKEALRGEPCLALIGDMVGSRELLPSRRPKIQERFKEFIQYLNKKYAKDILAKFVITLGDEFQGLLLSATPIPDLMWDIDQRFSDRDLRVGVGFGVLTTPIQKEAINVDGPALYNARAAIESARRKKNLGWGLCWLRRDGSSDEWHRSPSFLPPFRAHPTTASNRRTYARGTHSSGSCGAAEDQPTSRYQAGKVNGLGSICRSRIGLASLYRKMGKSNTREKTCQESSLAI